MISSLPSNLVTSDTLNNVPSEPKFRDINNNLTPSHVFSLNESVTIRYTSDRFSVDGVVLVGKGSGLQLNPENNSAVQMKRESSYKGVSTWAAEINVTSYTYFYAYSWSKTIANRTIETLDFVDGAPGHQMWVSTGPQYPVFNIVQNATKISSDPEPTEYYAQMYSNVTVVYDVTEATNVTQFVTLSLSNSSTGLYNASTSLRYNMTQTTFAVNSKSRFEFTFNLTQRLYFFSAFDSFGWDRALDNASNPVSRKLSTGFGFNTTFSEDINQYTSLDTISFNVTSVNQTANDAFFYRYRYFENASSSDPLVNWTDVSLSVLDTFQENITNNGANFTQDINIYRAILNVKFNDSQVVNIQPYVTYLGESYNQSVPYNIQIHDPRPTITILTANNTITRAGSQFVDWEFQSVRGSITSAVLTSNQTSVQSTITNAANYTYSFSQAGEVVEGYHLVTINATAQFDVLNISDFTRYTVQYWNVTHLLFLVDQLQPIANFTNPPTETDSFGFVTLDFTFFDPGTSPSGIKLVRLDWGDNTAINATSLSSATHTYRTSGTFTITLRVWDKVGNNANFSIPITVTVPTTETSQTQNSPISVISVLTSITFIALVIRMSRRSKL